MDHGQLEASPNSSCCHRVSQDQPTPSDQAPQPGSVECCCQRDLVPPTKTVELDSDSGFVQPCVADDSTAISYGDLQDQETSSLRLEPRLHVLQCVWRC